MFLENKNVLLWLLKYIFDLKLYFLVLVIQFKIKNVQLHIQNDTFFQLLKKNDFENKKVLYFF